ncbi:MAG: hypothetical protein IIW54_13105 [Lachnospiraceae bacterium]|nr:hypothetical protein [Lachnospiraceae bacterium]
MWYWILGGCLIITILNWFKWKVATKSMVLIMKEKGCVPTDDEIKAHSIIAIKNLFK